MNITGSIGDFFYNLIPGALFIIILNFFDLVHFSHTSTSPLTLILLTVISLSLGYLFQGIVIVFRHKFGWNEKIQTEVLYLDSKRKDNLQKRIIKDLRIKDNPINNSLFFYLMDAKLRGVERSFLPQHFSSLFAFWSNILCVLVIAFIIVLVLLCKSLPLNHEQTFMFIVFIPGAVISYYFANKFLRSFYDCLLNVYYTSL